MLAAEQRMRSSDEFRHTIHAGTRAGRRTVIVHVRPATPDEGVCRAGFVVSKSVGDAVTRNRVKRRLRHLIRPLISGADAPGGVVVRALPAAATEPTRLAGDLASAFAQAARGR